MRWLFVLLVLCNGALYLWYTGVGGSARPQGLERVAQREVVRLTLMSELVADQRRASPQRDPEQAAQPEATHVVTSRSASPGDGERQQAVAVVAGSPDPGAADQSMLTLTRQVDADAHWEHALFLSLFEKPQEALGPVKPGFLERPFLSPSKDRLVSRPAWVDGGNRQNAGMRAAPSDAPSPELGGAREVSTAPAGGASHVRLMSPEESLAERECFYLGGFAAQAAAQEVLDRLRREGLQGVLQAGEHLVEPAEYWVYIPDSDGELNVKRVRDDLSKVGIESYQVQRGDLQGAVSVGLYRNHESALALRRRLESLGFLARIRERGEYRDRYGILLVDHPQIRDNPLILQLNKQSGVKLEKKSCSGVASD